MELDPVQFKELLPKEWILEKFGIDPAKYGIQTAVNNVMPEQMGNEALIKLSGRQQQNLLRIVRLFSQGKLTKGQASIQLSAYGFTDDQINQYLGLDENPMMADQQFMDDSDEFIADMFAEYGEDRANFSILKSEVYTGQDDDLLFRCKKFNLPLDKKTYGKSTLKVMNNFSFTGDAFISVPIQPLQNDTLFDWRKSQTILITFQPNNIFCDPSKKKDDFTVFSIPGYDTCISYTSDRRYKVETWTDSNQCISINSEPMDEQWVQIAFVLDVKKKQIKFYLNNKLIGIEKMPSFFKEYVTEEPNFYLGVGDPYRSKDKNFFTGLISGFAVFDKELEEREIEFLYENINSFSLLTNFKKYKSSEDLAVYYDFQHYKQNKILDISGKGRHGEITNAYFKQTKEVFGKTISLPHRRISKFRKLNHYNNGWERGGWIQEETRLNQIRFMNDVSNNMIDVREDGLNNCLYNLVKEETFNKNIHHLFARI